MNDDFELPEGVEELTRPHSEWPRTRANLAEYGNCQQPGGRNAFDHGLVKPWISKEVGEVAEDQIHGRTCGKPALEIQHFEATAVGDAGEHRQLTREIDRHRGDVDCPNFHPPAGKPHRLSATTAPKLQGAASGGKEMLEGCEDRRWESACRRQPRYGVAAIPVSTVLLAHEPNPAREAPLARQRDSSVA
jgi:hypothetical protein